MAGTILLIAPAGQQARPLPLVLLARPWMVAAGKRSYSLYLWHWPVFSFVDYAAFQSSEPTRSLLKLGLALGLTALSYRFVERPARAYLNRPSRRRHVFAGTLLAVAVLAGSGVWIRVTRYFDVPPATIASGGVVVHGGDRATVILSGDSQAAMYGTEIGAIARAQGFTLDAVGTAGRNQLPGAPGTHWPAVARLIAQRRPDLVILANAWSTKLDGNAAPLVAALGQIAENARQVILITQPPTLPPRATRQGIRAGERGPFVEPGGARAPPGWRQRRWCIRSGAAT